MHLFGYMPTLQMGQDGFLSTTVILHLMLSVMVNTLVPLAFSEYKQVFFQPPSSALS